MASPEMTAVAILYSPSSDSPPCITCPHAHATRSITCLALSEQHGPSGPSYCAELLRALAQATSREADRSPGTPVFPHATDAAWGRSHPLTLDVMPSSLQVLMHTE